MWFLALIALCSASSPWVSTYTATRSRFVSASAVKGAGGTGTLASPLNLEDAIARGFGGPGDEFVLLAGNYANAGGLFVVKCDGSSTSPCVIRCQTGQRCTFNARVDIYANYVWVWGIEVFDVAATAAGGCPIGIWGTAPSYYTGVRIINSVFQNASSVTVNRNGVCSYGDLGTVLYGNIQYHSKAHGLYIQNDFAAGGIKYVVNNIWSSEDDDFAVHAYCESATHGMGQLSGLWFVQNVILGRRFLLGGAFPVETNNNVQGNVFGGARLQVGYGRPSQALVQGNFLGWAYLQMEYIWGSGGSLSTPLATRVTGNTIVQADDFQFGGKQLSVAAKNWNGASTADAPSFRIGDEFDNNSYALPQFRANLRVNSVTSNLQTQTQWKQLTGFDTNSAFDIAVVPSKVFLFPNEYDLTRAHVAVFHFLAPAANAVTIDLCCYSGAGSWSLFHYKSPYGPAIASGTSANCATASVTISTRNEAYLLTVAAAPSSGTSACQSLLPPAGTTTSASGTRAPSVAATLVAAAVPLVFAVTLLF